MTEVLYRYEDVAYAPPADEWGEFHGAGSVEVHLREYPVFRDTPCGKVIDVGGAERFVLTGAHRKFACATIDAARESFRTRKRRQISIHEARAARARRALAVFERQVEGL